MALLASWSGSPPSDSSASTRSSSSTRALSSSSSLASTFSDLSHHPATPHHSTGAKTHAFFASPFASDPDPPMSPSGASSIHNTSTPTPARSITADFFSTPVRTPSPPTNPTAKTLLSAIHPSRIFPSRYTSRDLRDDDESTTTTTTRKLKPEMLFLDLSHEGTFEEHGSPVLSEGSRFLSDGNFSLMPSPHTHPSRDLSSLSSISTSSSFGSTRSSLALPESTNPHRLPTPPPPPSPRLERLVTTDSTSEPTPRPSHLEPNYHKAEPDDKEQFEGDDIEVVPGCIITSVPPCITHPPHLAHLIYSPTLTVTPPPDTTTFAASITSPPLPLLASADHQTDNIILHLIRPLGQGAFSSVWLAEDKTRVPLALKSKKSVRDLRRKASLANLSRRSSARGVGASCSAVSLSRRSSLEEKACALERNGSLRMRKLRAKLRGTRPVGFNSPYLDERHGKMGISEFANSVNSNDQSVMGTESSTLVSTPHLGTNEGDGVRRKSSKRGRLVAVKMTPRRAILSLGSKTTKRERDEEEERTRVGFVREVEVLKHISHPNITQLLEHFSTPSHHILVLPYLPGGDLLGLVNDDITWSKLGENVLRRIWCELCKAVGWMHGVGLVHRDIKLENVLLTTPAFTSLTPDSARPTLETLPTPPLPLIKLTDFGLSRFIEIDEHGEGQLLSTRCGSEAYAAPELVMGSGSVRAQAARKRRDPNQIEKHQHEDLRGFYDARETDAWACGVVLYALVGRKLPFGEGVGQQLQISRIEGDGVSRNEYGRGKLAERRQWLMKIARGEYEWPTVKDTENGAENGMLEHNEAGEFVGQGLVNIQGVKRIVGRLLVRDPRKRARIMDLWDDEWMWGRGGGLAVGMAEAEWREWEREREEERGKGLGIGLGIDFGDARGLGIDNEDGQPLPQEKELVIDIDYVDEGPNLDEGLDEDVVEVVDDGEEGWLLDQEGIGSVARQEVV